MRTLLTVLALLPWCAACGGEPPEGGAATGASASGATGLSTSGQADWPGAAERTLAPDRAPTPYTAEQIRHGCPQGRVSVFRMRVRGAEMVQEWRFGEPDADGVTWTSTTRGRSAEAPSPSRAKRVAWKELQAHASYPAGSTVVDEDTVEVPAGRWRCMRYTVTETLDGKTVVSRYWFAWDLPGPPVKTEQTEDGKVIGSMEMIEHGRSV